jgi:predicted DNA-binding antitoxin AbrB/MazE fold protein
MDGIDWHNDTYLFAVSFRVSKRYNSPRLVHHAWKEIGRRPQGRRLPISILPCHAGVPAMSLEVEATYENGLLKPDNPLPLKDKERVKITVQQHGSVAELTYGLIGWTGDPEVLRKIAEDDEFGIMESP